MTYERKGNYSVAIAAFQKAVALSPEAVRRPIQCWRTPMQCREGDRVCPARPTLAKIFTLKSASPGVRIRQSTMSDEPTKDLATRAFQKRVIDEFTAIRAEQAATRKDITEMRGDIVEMRTDMVGMRTDIAEIRAQQAAMARNIAALDQRVTSIEHGVTSIEQSVTSIDQRITSIDQRLTTLEEKVDARLKETRPIWESVQEQLQRVVEKFDVVLRDIYDVRIDVQIHGRRIGSLERRAS